MHDFVPSSTHSFRPYWRSECGIDRPCATGLPAGTPRGAPSYVNLNETMRIRASILARFGPTHRCNQVRRSSGRRSRCISILLSVGDRAEVVVVLLLGRELVGHQLLLLRGQGVDLLLLIAQLLQVGLRTPPLPSASRAGSCGCGPGPGSGAAGRRPPGSVRAACASHSPLIFSAS